MRIAGRGVIENTNRALELGAAIGEQAPLLCRSVILEDRANRTGNIKPNRKQSPAHKQIPTDGIGY
jgi:hypothetical protein